MTATEEVVDALITSVNNLDASRRVGWAKAIEAENKQSDLERGINNAQSERDIYRRAMSFLVGFTMTVAESHGLGYIPREISKHVRAVRDLGDKGAYQSGVSRAQIAVKEWTGYRPDDLKQATLRALARKDRRQISRVRREVVGRLAEKYGFASIRDLHLHLRATTKKQVQS